jgi:hypothetical protein
MNRETGDPELVRLRGGPGNGQVWYADDDWKTAVTAAVRMGRTATEGIGWALGYRRERPDSDIWVWTNPS